MQITDSQYPMGLSLRFSAVVCPADHDPVESYPDSSQALLSARRNILDIMLFEQHP
jgi:hypothetical protein